MPECLKTLLPAVGNVNDWRILLLSTNSIVLMDLNVVGGNQSSLAFTSVNS